MADKVDDRTRILLVLLRQFVSNQLKIPPDRLHDDDLRVDYDVVPERGDLVLALTSGYHGHTVGWWVEGIRGGGIIRGIGTDRTCRIVNEGFAVLKLPAWCHRFLYEGRQRQIFEWACKSFSERWNKAVRSEWPWGVRIDTNLSYVTEDLIYIHTRPRVWLHGDESRCIAFAMKWDRKTRLKDICATVNEHVRAMIGERDA